MNTFGELFRLTTFGESHGKALGAVVDGCPAGVALLESEMQAALDRRRPGQSALTTARQEGDKVEILSGVFEDKTLGTPIAAVVRNADARSQDYTALKNEDRPGHADAVWRARFQHRDHRGGGRTSGRETLSRVIGGAVAEALLKREIPGLKIVAAVTQIGPYKASFPNEKSTRAQVDAHATRCLDETVRETMASEILKAKERGDSFGGIITVRVDGLPTGLGEPVFGKLKSRLADALAGVGTVSGLVWGSEDVTADIAKPGTEFHRQYEQGPSRVYGGIQGGLSNGEPLFVQVLMKPASTLQAHAKGGRHDPCILPRAVPVLEAMTALVLADAHLLFLARPHRA
jgi:chorismate synthase